MAATVRKVAGAVTVTDALGASVLVPAGTVVIVSSGSAQETAYGGSSNVPAIAHIDQGQGGPGTSNRG